MTGPGARRTGGPLQIVHVLPRMIGGGPERSVLAIAEQTASLGVDHEHVIAVLEPPLSSRLVVRAHRLGIGVVPRPDAASLAELVRSADIVQVHWWNHPLLRRTLETVELPACRLLVWARVLGTIAPQVLTEELGLLADRLVVTSPASRSTAAVRAADGVGTPVDIIPGVADMGRLEDFTPRRSSRPCVGYVGLVNDTKMHPRFVALAAAVDDPTTRFVVCGGGGGEEDLRRRAVAAGLGDRVEVRGHVEDVRAALEEFDVFGYPLAPETSATSEKALQEAMWVGVPPVVLPHPGTDELVEHGVSGLVVPEEEYPAAVTRLLHDEDLRRLLGEGARRQARERFDPTRWARRTIEVLDELVGEPRRTRGVLPGGGPAAAGFVRAMGEHGAPFAISLGLHARAADGDVDRADDAIGGASANLANGEGGIVHYRNTYPGDPHLRLWSGLVAASSGRNDLARSELEAAAELGLDDGRPARYASRLP